MDQPEFFEPLVATLKRSVAAFRAAEVPYLLGGSLAAWARGGPRPENDLDFMVKPQDAQRAQDALAAAGMQPEDPPEEWLLKAHDANGVLVDLIFEPSGLVIDDAVLGRGDEISVLSVGVRVMALNDVLSTKLMALNEHHLTYESLIAISRSLRESVDWDDLRARTSASPFARAYFVIVEGLGIAPAAGQVTGTAA
jgi:hypothetical protein